MDNLNKKQNPFSNGKYYIDFEEVFDHLGHVGLFQIGIFFQTGIPMFMSGLLLIASSFISAEPEHWCNVTRLQNYSHSQQKDIAIPYDSDPDIEYSRCSYYNLPWDTYTDEELVNWNRTAEVAGANVTSCQRWVYDESVHLTSIVNEWDLVCDSQWQVPLTTSISLSGMLVGAVVTGSFSDRFGRMPVFVVSNIAVTVFALACSFTPNIILFNVARFLVMFSQAGGTMAGYIMVSETFGPKYRTLGGVTFSMFFSAGFAIVAGIAYLIRDHDKLMIALAVPSIICVLMHWTVPESPRWLLAKGRHEEAMAIIRYMGVVNKHPLPDHMEVIIKSASDEQKRATFSDLFGHPVLRRITLIMFFVWFTSSLSYYTTSVNIGSLTGDIYTNTFIAGALEFPANTLCFVLLDRLGRRWTLSGALFMGGACLIATTPFYNTDYEAFVTVFTMLGKAGFTLTFTGIYVFTAEVIPTPVRNIGMGACSTISHFGTLSSPYFGDPLQAIWTPLPGNLVGVAAIVGGLLLLMLPETLNRKMPDCIEDTVRICRKKSLLLPSLYQDMAEQDVEDMSSETRDTASQCDVSSCHVDVNNDGVDNSGINIGETDDKEIDFGQIDDNEIDIGGINNVAYVQNEDNTNSAPTSVA